MMEIREEKVTKQRLEAANPERKRQLDSDSVLLLKLPEEVKSELDELAAHASSPDLQKNIEESQILAHAVQVKVKLAMNVIQ